MRISALSHHLKLPPPKHRGEGSDGRGIEALNEKGPSPFEPGPLYLTSWSNYFLTFAFLVRATDP